MAVNSTFDANKLTFENAFENFCSNRKNMTLKGESIVVVRPKHMDDLIASFQILAASATPANLQEMDGIKKKLEEATNQVTDLTAQVKLKKKETAELTKAYDECFDKHKKLFEGFNEFQKETKSNIHELKKEIEVHKNSAASHLKALKSGEGKFLPEAAQAIQERLTAAENRVTELSASISEQETALAEAKKEKTQNDQKLAEALRKNNAAMDDLTCLKNLEHLVRANIPLEPRKVIEVPSYVKAYVGTQSMVWLERLDMVSRANMRDRAFHLLSVAKHSENTKIRAFTVILNALFDWIKTKKAAVLVHLEGWLTELENDIKTMSVKALNYYRLKLQAIKDKIDNVKASVKKEQQKAKYTGWFGRVKASIVAIGKMTGIVSMTTKAVKAVSSFINKVTSPFVKARNNWNKRYAVARKQMMIANLPKSNSIITTVKNNMFAKIENDDWARLLAVNYLCSWWRMPDPEYAARGSLKECGFSSWEEFYAYVADAGDLEVPPTEKDNVPGQTLHDTEVLHVG